MKSSSTCLSCKRGRVFPNLSKFISTFRPKGYDILHAPFRLRVWYSRGLRECINIFIFFSPTKGTKENSRQNSRQNPPAKNAKQDPSWALGRKCASLIHSMQVLRSSWTVKCETYFNCGRPLENVWPRGRYQKIFAQGKMKWKKIMHAK